MTELMAGYFRMPERKVKLSEAEKADLLYLMIDGTERPVQRPQSRHCARKNILARKSATLYHIRSSQMIRSGYWLLAPPIMGANMTSIFMIRPAWIGRLIYLCLEI